VRAPGRGSVHRKHQYVFLPEWQPCNFTDPFSFERLTGECKAFTLWVYFNNVAFLAAKIFKFFCAEPEPYAAETSGFNKNYLKTVC
jgi:hypothetical protein